jgi:DNA-directed RNA polymerase subunit RPC12/RpoP
LDFKGTARKWLGGKSASPAAEAQDFEVLCQVCGQEVQGRRTDGYQAIRCPSCGGGLFILPRSAFREPPAAAGRRASRARDEGGFFDEPAEIVWTAPIPAKPAVDEEVEIEWEDEAPAEPAPAPPPAAPRPQAPASPRPRPARSPAAAPPAPAPAPGSATPRPLAPAPAPDRPAKAPRRREVKVEEEFVTLADEGRKPPIIPIFLAVGLLVAATVGYRLFQARRLDYPRLVAEGMEKGIPALEEGKFDLAKQILSQAAEAAEGLGRQVEHAEDVIGAAQEAALLTDLVAEPLEMIVDQAARHRPAAEWPEYFRVHYRGQSIVMEATIAGNSGPRGYELDYRILVGPGPKPDRVGRIDIRGFKLIEDQVRPKPGQSLVFGARLESVALDEQSGEWLVRLQPESGKLITHLRALTALGWDKGAPEPAPAPPAPEESP